MIRRFTLVLLFGLAARSSALPAAEPFVDEAAILMVSREDQSVALKTKAIKKEVTITEVVKVLTTYRVVSRDQYLTYDHTLAGASGEVKIKGRGTCSWSIEPGYAAVIALPSGDKIYLLKPDLKVPTANGK